MFHATTIMMFQKVLACCCASLVLLLHGAPFVWSTEDEGEHPARKSVSLAECIRLALAANRTVQVATLDRTVQKFNLRVAEDKFMPHGQIVSMAAYDSPGRNFGGPSAVFGRIFPTVSLLMPTGSEMSFSWLSSKDSPTSDLLATLSGQVTPILGTLDQPYGGGFDISIRQPLLKGGGLAVNKASVNIARLDEQSNMISLKSTVIDVITSVIVAYRHLQQAQKHLEIGQLALQRAKELLDINQILVKLGRMPALEIVQTERNVSSKELAIVTAKREVDAARLALIDLLDIDPSTPLVAIDEMRAQPVHPDLGHLLEMAWQHRPAYLQANLEVQVAQHNELVARNKNLWDLSLIGGYTLLGRGAHVGDTFKDMGGYGNKDWRVGVALTIPIRDLTLEQAVVTAKIASKQSQVRLDETRHRTEVAVQDAVRDVEVRLQQDELARNLRELSDKQFAVEQEKLQAGRSSIFQLVSYQDDLLEAQLREVEATVNYLNTLTLLDQTLGTTLQTWQIDMQLQ